MPLSPFGSFAPRLSRPSAPSPLGSLALRLLRPSALSPFGPLALRLFRPSLCMPKPIILAVDDDPEVLNAVDRDLRAHFRADYRVIKVGSGRHALETTHQLKQRGNPVALFLVDERMPEMTGTQFLQEA